MQIAGILTTRLKLLNVCIYKHVMIRYNIFIYVLCLVFFYGWKPKIRKEVLQEQSGQLSSCLFCFCFDSCLTSRYLHFKEIIFIMVVAKYGLVHDVETINQHLEIVSEI